jgi:hypothetical protein
MPPSAGFQARSYLRTLRREGFGPTTSLRGTFERGIHVILYGRGAEAPPLAGRVVGEPPTDLRDSGSARATRTRSRFRGSNDVIMSIVGLCLSAYVFPIPANGVIPASLPPSIGKVVPVM